MKVQTVLILVVALALGGAAVWLIAPLVISRGSTGGETVSVVTAAIDIARGGTIQTEMVHVESVPKRWANPKAIGQLADAVGRVATMQILAGEPVLSTKIAAKGAGVGLAAIIPKGMRAFTIQTPTIAAGVAGFILPGNKVDVLLTVKDQGGGADMHGGTITLLQNLEILAVDQRLGADPAPSEKLGATKELRSVTLLVTPGEAAKLDLGGNLGTLHLTLRNPEDAEEVRSTRLATIAELSQSHPGLLAAMPKPDPPPVQKTPPPRRAIPPEEIRTIRGNQEGMVRVFR